jgi:4'-phosphopantetheinyl transferase
MGTSLNIWKKAPSNLTLAPDEVHVWRVKLTVPVPRLNFLHNILSPDEQARAGRFYFEKDRHPWIVARGSLRLLLSVYSGVTPQQLTFSTNEYGKPSLVSPPARAPRFNLSHSRDLALYAFSWQRELGIDIEYMCETVDIDALSQHSFSPAEQRALQQFSQEERQLAFFRCWTRKEAYIKARGMGLSLPLHLFDVALTPEAALLVSREDQREGERWSFHDIHADNEYAGALAVEGTGHQIHCWELQKTTLNM